MFAHSDTRSTKKTEAGILDPASAFFMIKRRESNGWGMNDTRWVSERTLTEPAGENNSPRFHQPYTHPHPCFTGIKTCVFTFSGTYTIYQGTLDFQYRKFRRFSFSEMVYKNARITAFLSTPLYLLNKKPD